MPAVKYSIAGYAITRRQNAAAPSRAQVALLRHLCSECGVDVPRVTTWKEASEEIQLAVALRDALGTARF